MSSMPPPGHPMHPEMQAIWGPLGGPAPPPARPQPDPAVVQAALDDTRAALADLLPVLAHLVRGGEPPNEARHSATVGVRRFAGPPECPEGHPRCKVVWKSDGWGKGSSREQIVTWAFPAWSILEHFVYEGDGNQYGESYDYRKHSFYVDSEGTVYNDAVEAIGSVMSLASELIPAERVRFSDRSGKSPAELVRAETARWRAVLTGLPDPSSVPPFPYARTVVLPWLLGEMRKRNNPGLKKVEGSGMVRKKGWLLIQPSGFLFADGTIASMFDVKNPRQVEEHDLENLLSLARLSKLGSPPPRPS